MPALPPANDAKARGKSRHLLLASIALAFGYFDAG
jgi:hypothetical protein